jgi:hypothetical protein
MGVQDKASVTERRRAAKMFDSPQVNQALRPSLRHPYAI